MDVRGYVESHAREFLDDLKWTWAPRSPSTSRPARRPGCRPLLRGAGGSAYLWEEPAAIGPDLR
jgi:hypothetical protein